MPKINEMVYISTAQAGRIMDVTQSRIRQLIKEGKLAHHRIGETGWLYFCKKMLRP